MSSKRICLKPLYYGKNTRGIIPTYCTSLRSPYHNQLYWGVYFKNQLRPIFEIIFQEQQKNEKYVKNVIYDFVINIKSKVWSVWILNFYKNYKTSYLHILYLGFVANFIIRLVSLQTFFVHGFSFETNHNIPSSV